MRKKSALPPRRKRASQPPVSRAPGGPEPSDPLRDFVLPESPALQGLKRIVREASARYLHRPDVLGISVGWKQIDNVHQPRLCLRFHVREKLEQRFLPAHAVLPKTFMGVECDVVRAHRIRHLAAPRIDSADDRRAVWPTKRPGISVGIGGGGPGSLGLFVRDRQSDALGLLTCAHVVVPADRSSGAGVFQPAPADGVAAAPLARVRRFHVGPHGDAAFCEALADSFSWENQVLALDGAGLAIRGLRSIEAQAATKRLLVAKVGRTTGFTVGVLSAFYGRRKIETPWGEELMECAEVVPLWRLNPALPRQELTMRGDSGSVFYDPTDGVAFGVTMYGPDGALGSSEEYALICDLADVADELQVEPA